ncbi:nucleoid-associated protein [Escherichia coli]|uniref:nucleoid-associated protein n=1 Tax=Escherichia coli TaxID=562 RepID=UPI003D81AACB
MKGRVGRKVADFFMDFLGASEGLNAKAQNRGLLQAVDDFTAEAQLDKAERQNVRQQILHRQIAIVAKQHESTVSKRIFR